MMAVLPHHAGVDEAGRGCLVGSVFAAAVILPHNYDLPHLTDSKKLSEKTRCAGGANQTASCGMVHCQCQPR